MIRYLNIGIWLLIFFNLSVTAQDELVSFEISGIVTTDEGDPVLNANMQLSFVKLTINQDEIAEQVDENQAVVTDAEGRYSFQLKIDPSWSDFIIRLSSFNLDSFRYNLPKEKQLTDIIRNAITNGTFRIEVNWPIVSRETWKKELDEIRIHGENSEKGRLIRVRHLPDRIVEFTREGKRGEIWFYYADGIAIRFIGDKREKDFRFKPRQRVEY